MIEINTKMVEVPVPVEVSTAEVLRAALLDHRPIVDDLFTDLLSKLDEIP